VTSNPTANAAIGRADAGITESGCMLYRNGIGPRDDDHSRRCPECAIRLYRIAREREHSEYKIRGSDGRVLSATGCCSGRPIELL
jgi:hypothetical protein